MAVTKPRFRSEISCCKNFEVQRRPGNLSASGRLIKRGVGFQKLIALDLIYGRDRTG
jgi:hypothetical protein